MKKTTLCIVLCLLALNLFAWEGDGTQGNPYKISKPQDLMEIATGINYSQQFEGVYFIQTQDIDMASIQDYKAIGTISYPFKGNYDGQNYKIKNLKLIKTGQDYVGLFGCIDGSVIERVHITGDSRFEGGGGVGSIVGASNWSGETTIVRNCSSSAVIVARGSEVGGIIGEADIVENCTFTGSVTVVYEYGEHTGGIAGSVSERIHNCANYGNVVGNDRVGGICGYIHYGDRPSGVL
jgi:hypothetical protein